MPSPATLVAFRSDDKAFAEEAAEHIRRRLGLPVRAFAGVRDPGTGEASRYLTVAAPVQEVERLAPRAAVVGPDLTVRGCTYRSLSTIKADIARRIYGATGRGIVWAVIDSGVDGTHPHFRRHDNLALPSPLRHLDLTGSTDAVETEPADPNGHGTFIAGIIAGENTDVRVAERSWRDDGSVGYEVAEIPLITGMAPECKILSVKALDENAVGPVSAVIRALAAIQQLNSGRVQVVHGVNVGLDYEFDAERFACGRSPICIEVERLVRSGVVVVAAAGNTGYGVQRALARATKQGMEASIHDPGNAELVITVGSTDRELPQVYGVSYFSSKGPTLDGRLKPDLVAPGERIVSCATGARIRELREGHGIGGDVLYRADSGTSVAAAHVSGAAAALLSTRRELIGQPEALKAVLMHSAVDLGRSQFYQGRGVVDLLQAMQQNIVRPLPTQEQLSAPAAMQRNRRPEPTPTAVPVTPAAVGTARPLRVMYSYSRPDEVLKDELHMALAALRREALIEVWQDRLILPGSEFDKDIAAALADSDVIILLVSKYFIASDYCWGIEMKQAVQRHENGSAAVVPVILKPADWKTSPFGKLTALPRDGKPVTEWQNPDAAWADVAEGIRRLVMAKRAK